MDKRRASVVATLKDTLQRAPAYSAANRASQRRHSREACLGGRGLQELDEVLGSSNPFFGVKGKELKRAALRYLALPDGSEQTRVELALGNFIGKGTVFTGASVTCSESCKDICGVLTKCAASVDLKVPFVLATVGVPSPLPAAALCSCRLTRLDVVDECTSFIIWDVQVVSTHGHLDKAPAHMASNVV